MCPLVYQGWQGLLVDTQVVHQGSEPTIRLRFVDLVVVNLCQSIVFLNLLRVHLSILSLVIYLRLIVGLSRFYFRHPKLPTVTSDPLLYIAPILRSAEGATFQLQWLLVLRKCPQELLGMRCNATMSALIAPLGSSGTAVAYDRGQFQRSNSADFETNLGRPGTRGNGWGQSMTNHFARVLPADCLCGWRFFLVLTSLHRQVGNLNRELICDEGSSMGGALLLVEDDATNAHLGWRLLDHVGSRQHQPFLSMDV